MTNAWMVAEQARTAMEQQSEYPQEKAQELGWSTKPSSLGEIL